MTAGEKLKLDSSVTNTGDYDAEEVVQLYIRDGWKYYPSGERIQGFSESNA
jgi:hypothetical protein